MKRGTDHLDFGSTGHDLSESVEDSSVSRHDIAMIAPLVVEFYGWLSGTTPESREPDEIMSDHSLSSRQRRLLLDRIDDTVVIWGLTADQRHRYQRARLSG